MEFHRGLRGETPLNQLPNSVSKNLSTELNKSEKWIDVIERINPCFDRPLRIGEYRASANPSEKLILELGDRNFTVEVLAALLEDMQMFEVLSALLKQEAVKLLVEPGDGRDLVEVDLEGCLELRCTALGIPLPSIEWWRDNTAVDAENTPSLNILTKVENNLVHSRLKISNMKSDLQGKYFCIVTTEEPNDPKLNTRDVDVNIRFCKPKIIEQPENSCKIETQAMILTCKAIGHPNPIFQWYLNDQKIFDQQDSVLMIKACTKKQGGTYKCVVSNEAGFTESDKAIVTITDRNLRHIEPSCRMKASEKVALLIGNEGGNLKKPINDILLMAQQLKKANFKVIPLINLGFEDMILAIKMFSDLLKKDAYALFYYAGHGCQIGNEALIPHYEAHGDCASERKCCTETDEMVETYCITGSFIKDQLLKNSPKLRIMILDMCLKIFDCPCVTIPKISGRESSQPDLHYVVACATSKNLSSYETKSQPNGTYVTELSKYINPNSGFSILSIITEVNQVISEREKKSVASEDRMQIPKIDTNIFEDVTFLDDVIGDARISKIYNDISTPPRDKRIRFKNQDGFELEASVKFMPYKECILNSLLMVFDGINFKDWKLRIDAEKDIIGMETGVKETDKPNEFEIHQLQKLRSGINLSLFLLDGEGKIVAATELFIGEALIARGLQYD